MSRLKTSFRKGKIVLKSFEKLENTEALSLTFVHSESIDQELTVAKNKLKLLKFRRHFREYRLKVNHFISSILSIQSIWRRNRTSRKL